MNRIMILKLYQSIPADLITLEYNLEDSRCYSAIPAPRTFAWFSESLPLLKFKTTIQAIIGPHKYSFFLAPDCYFIDKARAR